jgi:hypothetical protein
LSIKCANRPANLSLWILMMVSPKMAPLGLGAFAWGQGRMKEGREIIFV